MSADFPAAEDVNGRAMSVLASLMGAQGWRGQLVEALARAPAIATAAGGGPAARTALMQPFDPEPVATLIAGAPKAQVSFRCFSTVLLLFNQTFSHGTVSLASQ